jgi:hypothetical protein
MNPGVHHIVATAPRHAQRSSTSRSPRVSATITTVAGGSEIALMMRASTEQLRDKYVATGLASDADIEGYLRFAQDPNAWGIYYATVRVLARR